MKIYCNRQFKDPQAELEHYLRQICDKDLWLAVRREDLYNLWVKASTINGKLCVAIVYNTSCYSLKYFMTYIAGVDAYRDADRILDGDYEVIHPVHMYSTEELASFICAANDEDRYHFSDYTGDDEE